MEINNYYQERDRIISLLQEGVEYIPQTGYRTGVHMRVGILCKS